MIIQRDLVNLHWGLYHLLFTCLPFLVYVMWSGDVLRTPQQTHQNGGQQLSLLLPRVPLCFHILTYTVELHIPNIRGIISACWHTSNVPQINEASQPGIYKTIRKPDTWSQIFKNSQVIFLIYEIVSRFIESDSRFITSWLELLMILNL